MRNFKARKTVTLGIELMSIWHFQTVRSAVLMGGYARYVWPAYGIVLFVIILHVLLSFIKIRYLLKYRFMTSPFDRSGIISSEK